MNVRELDENVLEDDYPVYAGYLYVADGKVIEAPMQTTVAGLRRYLKAAEIRRCDIYGRKARASSADALSTERQGG